MGPITSSDWHPSTARTMTWRVVGMSRVWRNSWVAPRSDTQRFPPTSAGSLKRSPVRLHRGAPPQGDESHRGPCGTAAHTEQDERQGTADVANHPTEVHTEEAGYEREGQEDGRHGGQPVRRLVQPQVDHAREGVGRRLDRLYEPVELVADVIEEAIAVGLEPANEADLVTHARERAAQRRRLVTQARDLGHDLAECLVGHAGALEPNREL